ncbi:MAG: PQQ-binding-like beta-propeller repeat protein [Tepidisphaerales bacterium]
MTRRPLLSCTLAMLLSMAATAQEPAARWPQFRGPGGSGIAEGQKPPEQFGPAINLLWKTPLPAGHSAPCIWNDRIFLTASAGREIQTLGISRQDGSVLWRVPLAVQKLEPINGTNSLATPTPATDGQRVYACFGSFGAVAYDLDGHELWRRQLPVGNVRHGSAASPILAGGKLIINGDQERWASVLIALDPATGEIAWQTPRPQFLSSHTTPIQWSHDGVDEVVVAGSVLLAGYDLKDGAERWRCSGLEAVSICPSPVIGDGAIYAMSYSIGEEPIPTWEKLLAEQDADKDGRISRKEANVLIQGVFSIIDTNNDGFITADEYAPVYQFLKQGRPGLFAVRAPVTAVAPAPAASPAPAIADRGPAARTPVNDITATHKLWTWNKPVSTIASPLFYQGRIYLIRDGGMLTCLDAKTGAAAYENKRVGATGEFWASPLAADGRIYLASRNGSVCVVAAGDEFKTIAKNEMGERITATPAIADNKLYIRTEKHLWAFGTGSK